MKTKWIFLFLALCGIFHVNAQEKTGLCEDNLTLLKKFTAERDYTSALVPLMELKDKCPKFSEEIYILGEPVLRYKTDVSASEEEKKKNVEELTAFFDTYDRNFPGNKNGNAVKKIMVLHDYEAVGKEEVFKLLDKAFVKKPEDFTDLEALSLYSTLYIGQFQGGENAALLEQLPAKYAALSGQLLSIENSLVSGRGTLLKKQETLGLSDEEKQWLADAEKKLGTINLINENIDKLFSGYFSCDKLATYYEDNFEAIKTNPESLERAVHLLLAIRCYKSPVLQKAAQALYEKQPSARSSYYMGAVAEGMNKKKEALEYYNKSAAVEPSPVKKSDLYYKMATISVNLDKKMAKEYALKSAAANTATGKPYVFLANMYAASGKECAKNAVEAKALNWLAIATARKAEEAEPKYKASVDALIKKFEENTPTKKELSAAGLKKGKEISYGCWINETVVIPKL